jgi:hypothetical protein
LETTTKGLKSKFDIFENEFCNFFVFFLQMGDISSSMVTKKEKKKEHKSYSFTAMNSDTAFIIFYFCRKKGITIKKKLPQRQKLLNVGSDPILHE